VADLSSVAVIFDLDGTLVDSAPDIHATANRVMARLGFGALPFDTVQSFVGKGLPNLVARLLETHGAAPEGPLLAPTIAQFETEYLTAHDLTTVYPGVLSALGALQSRGAALGLCTNKPIAPTMALLNHLHLTPFFAAILGGNSLPVRKPNPEHLLATARKLSRPKVIFVGDSEVDAETATAADVPFLLFTEGYRRSPVSQIAHSAAFAQYDQLWEWVTALV
jgi:phosphoglycolate phosphatase